MISIDRASTRLADRGIRAAYIAAISLVGSPSRGMAGRRVGRPTGKFDLFAVCIRRCVRGIVCLRNDNVRYYRRIPLVLVESRARARASYATLSSPRLFDLRSSSSPSRFPIIVASSGWKNRNATITRIPRSAKSLRSSLPLVLAMRRQASSLSLSRYGDG